MTQTAALHAIEPNEAAGVALLGNAAQASAILIHPVRLRILEALLLPDSAAGLSRRMGIPRQTLNYHVRELLRAKLLSRTGRRRNRNFYEQRYVTAARGFVLSPDLLGNVAAKPSHAQDAFSAGYLLALASMVQRELGRVSEAAARAGKRVTTFSIETKLRFRSAEECERFGEELRKAVFGVVARNVGADWNDKGYAAEGRPVRLVLGCYPVPVETATDCEEKL